MPLTTELERRQQAEILRLAEELHAARQTIAALQAAQTRPSRRVPPHVCAGCGAPLDEEATALVDPGKRGWLCVTCWGGVRDD